MQNATQKNKCMDKEILRAFNKVKTENPLIHCITNPISINDCANAILAVGASPIMAQHPEEVYDITKASKALVINLGNITDVRMKSFNIAAESARENHIPIIIDIVGVCCSKLRMDFTKKFISKCAPTVIKGNISEIKAISNLNYSSVSIDADESDKINTDDLDYGALIKRLSNFAAQTHSTLVATGETDLVISADKVFELHNGCKKLSRITGTGCVSTVLIACYLSYTSPEIASVIGISALNISGEYAYHQSENSGLGSFKISIHDHMSTLTDEKLTENIKIGNCKY